MEALSSLNTIYLLFILILECIIAIILLLVLLFKNVQWKFEIKENKKIKLAIAKVILAFLKNKISDEEAIFSLKGIDVNLLLTEVEFFNNRFNTEGWKRLKTKIAIEYFLPLARHQMSSNNWRKRDFSARAFALTSLKEDESKILSLMDDSHFLVSSNAAVAGLQFEKDEFLDKIIYHMSSSFGYAYYFYRDLIIESSSRKTFNHIEELANTNLGKKIHLVCLDLLSQICWQIKSPFFLQDIQSNDRDIRLAALKVFEHNPQIYGEKLLIETLNDPDEEIRFSAIKALACFRKSPSLNERTR